MENKVSIWKNSVNYTRRILAILVYKNRLLYRVYMFYTLLGYLVYLILAFAMYLGAINWRDKSNDGWMSYGEAFKTGFYVTLIAAVLGLIYSYVFFNFIDPEFIGTIMSKSEEAILESNPNISDADLDRALEMSAKFTSSTMLTVMGFIITVILGTILASIVAIFAKKSNPIDAI